MKKKIISTIAIFKGKMISTQFTQINCFPSLKKELLIKDKHRCYRTKDQDYCISHLLSSLSVRYKIT